MTFDVNHPIIFAMVAVVIAVVLAQSVFFLVKAWKRGIEIGMDKKKLRKIAVTATVFTIAPAVAIVISVIALSKQLGLALPWLRLSVVGSLSYEAIAAENTANAMGLGATEIPNASQFVTVVLVMTLSIMVGIWLVPAICKKMQSGMINLEKRDKKWADIFNSAMFIGMIAAFVGFVFCDVGNVVSGDFTGLIPVCVMFVSAVIMAVCGLLAGKFKNIHWIADYALPLSLILGMASAIPITAWLS
ncbi:MAG: DUF5058 family protein [Clostridia bacterium]|nr:DUF5058 family protein [Clostridia bacterium]